MSEDTNEEKTEPSVFARIGGFLKHVPGAALLFAIVPLLVLGYVGWYYYGQNTSIKCCTL